MLNFNPFPKISTERLNLRKLTLSDDNEIHELRSNEDVNKYLDRPVTQSTKDAGAFISKINNGITNNEWIFWAISGKDNDNLMGTICLWNFSEDKTTAEVGFELLPKFQRRGIIHEALRIIIDYGFKELDLKKIVGYTNLQNTRSIRVMEKFNFQQDKIFEEVHSVTGKTIQTIILSLEAQNRVLKQ